MVRCRWGQRHVSGWDGGNSLDYVVFGIGFGATILVLGLLLRDFGPRIRFRRALDGGDVLGAEELVAKVSWTRFCTALGSVLALAGAAFLIITLVAMILVVSDDTGLWIMSSAFGVLLVVIAYWTWAYFHRFGSYGILPERAEPEPAFSEPRRAPQSTSANPPAPAPDDDFDDDESYEVESPASEDQGDEFEDDSGDLAEDLGATGIDEAKTETEPRLQTPEERLAHAESPIDHGSAEGDLDLAVSGPRRPGAFSPRHTEADHDHIDTGDSADEEGDADEGRANA